MALRLEAGSQYSLDDIVAESSGPPEPLEYSSEVRGNLESSRQALESLILQDREIYGVTTGFGDLVDYDGHIDSDVQGKRLIYHLGVGTGEWLRPSIVRAALLIRAITLSRGYSGVRPDTFDKFCQLIGTELRPAVPSVGSLGASGDLIPMANAILTLMGEGTHLRKHEEVDSGEFFRDRDIDPLQVDAREALALVNGVPVCSAMGCFALKRFERHLDVVEEFAAWLYASVGCSKEPFSNRLNTVKGHSDQKRLADRLRKRLSQKTLRETDRPLQEVYSIRGIPQILGSARRSLRESREVLVEEINGVDDNPIVYQEQSKPRVQHGANFIGQSLAFAYDRVNEALTQIANLIERQLSVLLDPERNGGFEPMLAGDAGPNSGLAGAQLNATSILSTIRNNDQSYGSSSLTTNGGNQDVVPMTMEAGRNLMNQLDRFSDLLAIQGLALRQYDHRIEEFQGNEPDWFPEDVKPLEQDRPLQSDVNKLSQVIDRKFDGDDGN